MGPITRSSAAGFPAKNVTTRSATMESSLQRSNPVTKIAHASASSALATRAPRTKPAPATAGAAESTKFVLGERRVTRSCSSAKSTQIDDELLCEDPKTIDTRIRPLQEGVQNVRSSPEDDQDIKPTAPSIIGQSGSYQIFKLCVMLPKQVLTRQNSAFKPNKTVGSDIKLGLSLECKEWIGKKLRNSFEGGPTSYTIVKDVKPGSIAEQAGALKDDILVWCKGPEPVIFHQLDPRSQMVVWQLIDETRLEEKNPSRQLKASGFFTFYVARPFINESSGASEPRPATRLSTADVFLSDSIVTRARQFNSLTAEEKVTLLRDASDDAKKCFESDRNAVFESLPDVVKKSFNQIGFAEWGTIKPNTYQPVLALSPFRLSGASPVRRAWFENYENRRKNNKLSTMPHLVYWYGEVDENSQFSMLQQRKFLPLKEAMKSSCFGLPTIIQEKVRQKRKLTAIEKARVRAQNEMEADLQKKSDERSLGRIPSYAEPHETIREIDLERLATTSRSGARSLIENSKKRTIGDCDYMERCALRSDRVSIPSLMTYAEAKFSVTYGLSKRIELILDEKAPPISEAEYQNLQAMMTVFCRIPLLDEFILSHEELHPETAEKYAEIVTYLIDLTHVCGKIRHRQYTHLRDVRLDIWRVFANSVNFYSQSDCDDAKRFISVALHLRDFFNILWQEYMVPSDPPSDFQDGNDETKAAYKVLQNACERRQIEREQRLAVVGELPLNNDFTDKLASHLLKFFRDGGIVDGLDDSPLFDNQSVCSYGMKMAIKGIRNFCVNLSRETDQTTTVGSLFLSLRASYAYDCFKHHVALGCSLRNRLDRLLWKLIAPLYEISCRGCSHSVIWGNVETVIWARKPSQQEAFWPGLCLGVLASPSRKSRNDALIQRNEIVFSSRIRSELQDTRQKFEESLKSQSFYLVEFLESHTFSWVPEKDVITGFDGVFDPNKRKAGRMMNSDVVTSPEYVRAFEKSILVLFEQRHKSSELNAFTGDTADKQGKCSFEKLANSADVDRKRGYANNQGVSSISSMEEANCLLASEGLLDFSTLRHTRKSTMHPPLQTRLEFPPLDLQPSEKRLRSTIRVPRAPHVAGRQIYADDHDVESIPLTRASCSAMKAANRSGFNVADPSIPYTREMSTPKRTNAMSVGTNKVSPCSASRKNSAAFEPSPGSPAQVVSSSSFTKGSKGAKINGQSYKPGNEKNTRSGRSVPEDITDQTSEVGCASRDRNGRSQPIEPSADTGADLFARELSITNPDLSDAFLKLAREGQQLQSTNIRLWNDFVQRKQDLEALQGYHREKVAAFNVLLDSEEFAEEDEGETADSAPTELAELSPPTTDESGEAFLMGFATYIQKAVRQNAMLVNENDKLQEKISNLQARHDNVIDLA